MKTKTCENLKSSKHDRVNHYRLQVVLVVKGIHPSTSIIRFAIPEKTLSEGKIPICLAPKIQYILYENIFPLCNGPLIWGHMATSESELVKEIPDVFRICSPRVV
ncbi:Hypothetical protein FKW44_010656 [Caligus rogercresseyi]|uniref:Uncharacterized protein n=1 Tax=Caligus rogercresseyi TaxID=217165 RepID=A0A7T8HH74_CALRO|nr:Hypothetical protein FKW44_010656 [Caligus rogercresseyi]